MNEDIFFSVILPSYNMEAYIKQAIECLMRQTYNRLEIIVVDDCSTDGTRNIAENYEKCNSSVTVLHHEENRGLSASRNSGLKIARGNYVLFMDPDDILEENALETVALALKGKRADVLVFSLAEDYYDEHGNVAYSVVHSLPTQYLTEQKAIHEAVKDLEAETMYGYAWNKIYNRAYLEHFGNTFNDVPHIEDFTFNVGVFENVKDVVILSDVLYHYRNANQVRLTSKYLPNYFELQKTRVSTFLGQQKKWETYDKKAATIAANAYFRSFMSSIQRDIEHGLDIKAIRIKAKEELSTPLYIELKGDLNPKGKVAKILYKPLAEGKVDTAINRAKMIAYVKTKHPNLFAKLKQSR